MSAATCPAPQVLSRGWKISLCLAILQTHSPSLPQARGLLVPRDKRCQAPATQRLVFSRGSKHSCIQKLIFAILLASWEALLPTQLFIF